MDSDERFKHLSSDPRFRTLRKKQHKVKIDERFQSMFTDEKFTLKYSKDKRGRKNKKTSGDDLKRYYSLEKEDEESKNKKQNSTETPTGTQTKKDGPDDDFDDEVSSDEIEDSADDEESLAPVNKDEDDDRESLEDEELGVETESDVSSSSDESESEEDDHEDGGPDIEVNKIQYDWQPLDHDAEQAGTVTRRLAIQNLDWNHLDVRDIYTLVNSIRPPLSVRIYISEFGKERLAKEEVDGPQELADMPQIDEEEEELKLLKNRMDALEKKDAKIKTYRVNEYEDADEVLDMKNEEIRERIRRYQLSRMKYYYAIVDFDSAESAEIAYKELDGIEYEGSSLELDLRFVPDDMEFDPQDVKAECNKVPDLATYKAPQFINSALQQTTVKFTWDETDVKRQEKLHRAYTKDELDKDDLDAYLASETDDENEYGLSDNEEGPSIDYDVATSDKSATRKGNAEKYRQLLKTLDEEAERKKKVDVDVVWGDYEADEQRTAAVTKKERKTAAAATAWQDKKTTVNGNRKKNKKKDLDQLEGKDEDGEIDLLVMDGLKQTKQKEFQFNPDDNRFGAVYESGLYNIDPSHPNFKRTEAFEKMAQKKREKRQKTTHR